MLQLPLQATRMCTKFNYTAYFVTDVQKTCMFVTGIVAFQSEFEQKLFGLTLLNI